MTQPIPIEDLRQQITDICFENGGVTKPMVDKLERLIQTHTRLAEITSKIDVYQRLMLWLENQDDNDQLALLAKDIDVELTDLFAQLKSKEGEVWFKKDLPSVLENMEGEL